jgi:hypothetical protein
MAFNVRRTESFESIPVIDVLNAIHGMITLVRRVAFASVAVRLQLHLTVTVSAPSSAAHPACGACRTAQTIVALASIRPFTST